MTKRKYTISIHTSRMNGVHTTVSDVPFPLMKPTSVGDEVKIFRQKIVITGVRNKKYDLEDILEYKQNTLYAQMYKALIYIFLAFGKRVTIRSIKVERAAYNKSMPIDRWRQPINGEFNIVSPISPAVLSNVWTENRKGYYFRVAASHYLIGLSSKDRYIRFERLWRAFEQIAFWHLHHEAVPVRFNDFNALVEMRAYFETSPAGLASTFAKVDAYGIRSISMLHWKQMIRSEFPYKDRDSLIRLKEGFIEKNGDTRMLLAYRKAKDLYKAEWNSHGLSADIDNITAGYRAAGAKNNEHLLSVILCKYCYFMRNKMFHGEVADFSFCFTNHTEDDNITDLLNDLLSCTINDLLNDYDNL